MSPRHPRRRVVRALSMILVAGQVVGSVPVWAQDPPSAPAAGATSAPPPVKVNRTVPQVRPVPLSPVFSSEPTDEELFRARVFGEPMVPTAATSLDENRDLAQALSSFLAGRSKEDFTPIVDFLDEHPDSPWRVALLTNLGLTYRQAGYFTRALTVWKEAWDLGKDETEPRVKALAERSLAEFLDLSMRFGRHQVLETLLDEVEGRDIGGSAGEKVIWARRGLWLLMNKHDMAIPSGPTALDRILALNDPSYVRDPRIAAFHPTFDGAGLDQMDELAREVGLKMRMAFREVGAPIPLPALVHLKAGHYSAIVREEGGSYLLHDPILGQEIWMTRKALAEESSGYFLIPGRSLPQGWRAVQASEGAKIRGKCAPCHQEHPGAMKRPDPATGGGSCRGLAVASFHLLLVNLTINDSPVGYWPSRGPSVHFQVTYNHRETFQPAVFSYSNLGAKWTFDWLSYVQDNPAAPSASATVYARGGGYDIYTGFSGGSYAPEPKTRAVLVRTSTSPIQYEHRLADGTVEVLSQSDGSSTSPRRIFLTEVRDPQNQTLTFTYDATLRLVAATDALGQVSTVSYEDTDPLKITKVTDPFGRFATFEYTAGKLTRITDVVGLTSEFTYQAGDFVSALTTPYGTTTFAHGVIGANTWAELTDAVGGKERVEYGLSSVLPATEPPANVPPGFTAQNQWLNNYLSLHWTKRAMMATYPGDHSVARQTRWLIDQPSNYVVSVPHSTKDPLENRVWYAYPGQTQGSYTGTMDLPAKVARVLDDGQTQLRQYEYNALGKVTRATDPLGRETLYEYATNDLDLLRIKQKNGSNYDILWSATYNSLHQSLTVTDTASQVTTYTYLADGRLQTTVTPPRNGPDGNPLTGAQRTTTYTYYPDNDTPSQRKRLQVVTGPSTAQGSPATSYTYDAYGRVRTTTDQEGHARTFDYDGLDRVTKTTFPDSTFQETVYNRLDAERRRDRLGRWSHTFHDALRRVAGTRDPEGRTTTYEWCTCGSMDKLIDANGNATRWERDVQGRITRTIRPDGSYYALTYESTTSRLKLFRDPRQQVIEISYLYDNNWSQVSYSNTTVATPTVSFTYDPSYVRLATMSDSTGATTTYGYHPVDMPPALGAGQLATVDGPLANDVISYSYDELGRASSRSINGTGVSLTFDALGRLAREVNALGTFDHAYDGATPRLLNTAYPNGQSTSFAYFGNSQDHRLQEIHNRRPGGATLSRFEYAQDANGTTKSWLQQTDSNPANLFELGHDRADQLTSATLKTTSGSPPVLTSYGYAYDKAGNRTTEAIDTAVVQGTYDSLNRLVQHQVGGSLRFAGTLNEPAAVTVASRRR